MFEQTFVGEGQTKKPVTVLVAFAIQTVVLVVLAIIPMIWFDVLPAAQFTSMLVAPPPPPPPPPPPAAAPPPVKVVKMIPRQFDAGKLMAPTAVPKAVAQIKEDELPPPTAGVGVMGGVPGGVAGGSIGGVLGGIIGSVPVVAPPPPPPAKKVEAVVTPQRVRVGGNVRPPRPIRQPSPIYPPLAKQARISGVVRLSAVISRDGTIQELKAISGHPLLIPAALEAVKQWLYEPTLLNGEPVEVDTQIDVTFTLNQ